MPITVAPAAARPRAKNRWLDGKNGSTNTTFMPGMVTPVTHKIRWLRSLPGVRSPHDGGCLCRAVPAGRDGQVRRRRGPAAGRRACGDHLRAGRPAARAAAPGPGGPLAHRRPAGRRADRRRGRGPVRPARAGAADHGRARAAADTARAGPRAPGHPGHGRGDREQLPGQGADEVGAAGRGRAVRPAPAGRLGRGRRGLRAGGRVPAGRQAARGRRGEEHVPPGRRARAGRVAGQRAAHAGTGRPCWRSSSPARRAPTTA